MFEESLTKVTGRKVVPLWTMPDFIAWKIINDMNEKQIKIVHMCIQMNEKWIRNEWKQGKSKKKMEHK
jgi:hypothetical protein